MISARSISPRFAGSPGPTAPSPMFSTPPNPTNCAGRNMIWPGAMNCANGPMAAKPGTSCNSGFAKAIRRAAAITTTPRPIPLLREIFADPGTAITKGITLDNADNLAPGFVRTIVDRYGGTRLGRQELNAEILDDIPGAMWTREMLDDCRVKTDAVPDMARVVVGVDPSRDQRRQG